MAISLDIVNAFNALPCNTIREALVYHRVPSYLQAIVGSYLHDRYISYVGQNEARTEVYCGVPQGSILGPLLWNLAYDAVVELPAGISVVCYVDDMLVLSCRMSFEMTRRLAELRVEIVVAKICKLGLRIAPHKTEALWFHK